MDGRKSVEIDISLVSQKVGGCFEKYGIICGDKSQVSLSTAAGDDVAQGRYCRHLSRTDFRQRYSSFSLNPSTSASGRRTAPPGADLMGGEILECYVVMLGFSNESRRPPRRELEDPAAGT